MSKRARTSIQDVYYQDWCFLRQQAEANQPEEWSIRTPRPIQAPPAGRFYAIEIHSIEFKIEPAAYLMRLGPLTHLQASLTFAPRSGHDVFITGPGYPHNLWWYDKYVDLAGPEGPAVITQGSHESKTFYTDDLGHGRLTAGDDIFLQVSTGGIAPEHHITYEFAIQYTFKTVSCTEYTQHLTEIATAGY